MPRWSRIVVTGATSGVGEAFARLAPADAALLLSGRDTAKLAALAGELGGARTVETIAADLSVAEGRAALIDAAAAFEPDLLINNAGFGVYGQALDNPIDGEIGMVETNARAPIELTRALAPAMIAKARDGRGRAGVVFVSSIVAFAPFPRYATYAATKAFINSYAEALAEEQRDEPIDILALCPGATRTAFHARSGNAFDGPMDSAERVAREGYAAIGRRVVHVVNPRNKLVAGVIGNAPRSLMTRAIGAAMRRRRPAAE
ncbi:MAG: SDR family NAD(P)-dependent oxidoreductase [Pseudomonadota bacterium]